MQQAANAKYSVEQLAIKQRHKLSQLGDLLEKELQALSKSETPDIISLSAQKADLIAELSDLDKESLRLSEYLSDTSNQKDEPLKRLLEEVRLLAEDCMKKNQRNGQLVAAARSTVLSALDVVRQEPASQLYSPRGICEHEQEKKSLGTA